LSLTKRRRKIYRLEKLVMGLELRIRKEKQRRRVRDIG
jgi:hypothetical protein